MSAMAKIRCQNCRARCSSVAASVEMRTCPACVQAQLCQSTHNKRNSLCVLATTVELPEAAGLSMLQLASLLPSLHAGMAWHGSAFHTHSSPLMLHACWVAGVQQRQHQLLRYQSCHGTYSRFAMKLVIAASDILAKDHRSVLRSNLCNSVTAYSCSMTQ